MKRISLENKNFLAIDVGNTNIHVAFIGQKKMFVAEKIPTSLCARSLSKEFKSILLKSKKQNIKTCLICSVVPKCSKILKELLSAQAGSRSLTVGSDIKVPLKSYYRHRQIGQDRLVCAYGAKELYGTPLIIIDLGTAITCDVVSPKGEYQGGIIIPGIHLSVESLFNKTALLPRVTVMQPKNLIGRDTQTSILSGIFYGYGALLDGLIERICEQKRINPKVILTGGHASLMKKYIRHKIYTVNDMLVFEGLKLLASNYHC